MELHQLIDNMNKARADFKSYGQKALKEAFMDFFMKAPEITSISWVQFTPYFNDGDVCEFTLGEVYFQAPSLMGFPEESGNDENYHDLEDSCIYSHLLEKQNGKSWSRPPVRGQPLEPREKELLTLLEEFTKIFKEEALFEEVFGDHVMVKATRLGFDTEEFEHD